MSNMSLYHLTYVSFPNFPSELFAVAAFLVLDLMAIIQQIFTNI